MSDDFQVKQSSSGSGAYGLTGSVVGAAAGGLGAHYLTKPKYSSHEDIINEAKDSADFKTKLENAQGEEKTFLQAAKDVADEKSKAEKTWNDEFKAYQEAHKEGLVKDEAYLALEKKQEEAQKLVNDLEAKAQNSAVAESTGLAKKDPLAVIRENVKNLDNAREELRQLKSDNAPKEAIDKVTARIKKYETRLNNTLDKIVESTDFNIENKKELEAAKKAYKAELQGYAQEYGRARDKFNSKLPENEYKVAKSNIQKEEKAIDKALAQIKELTARKGTIQGQDFAGYDLTEALKNNNFERQIEAIKKVEANKTTVLENLLKNYNNVSGTPKTDWLERLVQAYDYVVHNKEIPASVSDKEALENFVKNLTDNEKKLFEGKEVTKETIEQLLNESKARTAAIENAAETVKASKASIETLEKAIERKQEAVVRKYGKGAYINDEGIICKKGKPIEKAKTPQLKLPEFKTELDVKLPKEIEVQTGVKKVVAESPELVEARKNLEELAKQIEEAKKGLKSGAIDEKQQIADFIKEKGYKEVKNKDDFINQQVKEKTDKFAKEFESQFKRKYGFAEHAGWKIAGAAAAGALIIGGIASLMSPKDRA